MIDSVRCAPHPLLDAVAFETVFAAPLGELAAGPELRGLLVAGATAPVASSDELRGQIRDLLRHGGYKPTGRGKPASEYLLRAVAEGALGAINLAVDACNAVSYHSGLPISVVDADKIVGEMSIDVAPSGTSYVFNASGQVIELGGLLCLFDGEGPCANAVKDAQRTKTNAATTRTVTVLWGTRAAPSHSERTFAWYQGLLEAAGAKVRKLTLT
ncbi:MAG: phenylalanine--tRNA ligase beta subunit-related protein [Polyangiaceae bacterium]